MRRILALAFLALLSACQAAPVVDPAPPRPRPSPPPIPIPPVVDPVDPVVVPVDPAPAPADVVAWAKVQGVKKGMSRVELLAHVGRKPDSEKDMRDGTRSLRWAAQDEAAQPRWMDVTVQTLDADRDRDIVMGRGLWPR